MISTIDVINQLLFLDDSLPEKASFVMIMGGRQPSLVHPAVEVYKRGIANKIVISGHSSPKLPGYTKTECDELSEYAVSLGIPEQDIILEYRSTNTLENFVFSRPIIDQIFEWNTVQNVIICCKNFHSRRVLMTAQKNWPSHVHYIFQTLPAERFGINKEDWWQHPQAKQRVLEEIERIAKYTLQGDIGDF